MGGEGVSEGDAPGGRDLGTSPVEESRGRRARGVEVRERRTSRTGSVRASAPLGSGGSVESFSTECGDASRGSFGSFPGDERHESRSWWLGDSVMAVPARPGAPSMAPPTPVRDALALERDPRSTPETSSRVSRPAGVRAGAVARVLTGTGNVSFSN